MNNYFDILYSKFKVIKNDNTLLLNLEKYLNCEILSIKHDLYKKLSDNAWDIQKKISIYFDIPNKKFFFGIVKEINNESFSIWDSSAVENNCFNEIKLLNLASFKDNIIKFRERNNFSLNNKNIEKNYIKNYSKSSCNPSIIIPIINNKNYTIYLFIHAWINNLKEDMNEKLFYYSNKNIKFNCINKIDDNKSDDSKSDDSKSDDSKSDDSKSDDSKSDDSKSDDSKSDDSKSDDSKSDDSKSDDNQIILENKNIINTTRNSIRYNKPIEDKLNVIIVMSNPCKFKRRIKLAKEFILRMNDEQNVNLYIVELAYDCNPKFEITNANNKSHLQLRCKTPLWHKENMINIGIKKLLPSNWKSVAWIDADIEFDSESWALDTLKILNGYKDVVQLFSHFIHMKKDKTAMGLNNSFGFKFCKNDPFCYNGASPNFWHPGFAWAMNREAYEQMEGIYQDNIIGGGDYFTALCLKEKLNIETVDSIGIFYKDSIIKHSEKCFGLKLGYTPGIIRHYFHGSLKNRNYKNRYSILEKYNYNHKEFIKLDENGLMVPTNIFSEDFKEDIYNFFCERNEDED